MNQLRKLSVGVLALMLLMFVAPFVALANEPAAAPAAAATAEEATSNMGTGADVKAGKAHLSSDVKIYLAIASGFCIAIAAFGGAMAQSKAIAAAVTGIARNPGASGKVFVPMIVGLALIESLVLYAWIVALQLAGKI